MSQIFSTKIMWSGCEDSKLKNSGYKKPDLQHVVIFCLSLFTSLAKFLSLNLCISISSNTPKWDLLALWLQHLIAYFLIFYMLYRTWSPPFNQINSTCINPFHFITEKKTAHHRRRRCPIASATYIYTKLGLFHKGHQIALKKKQHITGDVVVP